MASVRSPKRSSGIEPRDGWRRRVVLAQGVYYIVSGLWPIIHFSSFTAVVRLQLVPFQAHAFAALLVVVGAMLVEASRNEPPGPFPTLPCWAW